MVKFVVPTARVNYKYKVYFNKQTGDILSITNSRNTPEGDYFETDYNEVKHLLGDNERIIDWKAVYNTRKFGYDIVSKVIAKAELEIDDFIYEIKQCLKAQIYVVQNCKQKMWTVSISQELRSLLKEKGARLEEILFFSVTANSNPNILIRTFSCSVADLVSRNCVSFEFKSQKEVEIDTLSVYTNRKFEFYTREVLL